LALRLEPLEDRTVLSVFTVTNTNDSGPGSLRQAIFDANTTPGMNTVAFNIGGGGVQTIRLSSSGLLIGNSITVDGTTQPGYSGAPLIEVNGSQVSGGPNSVGLAVGDNATVRGLVVNGFTGAQIGMGTGAVLAGNYIGTDVTGTRPVQGDPHIAGIGVRVGTNDRIGGTTAADRNLISGNFYGVYLVGGSGGQNVIEGNYIGTNAAGSQALANTYGVDLEMGNNTVGGVAPGAGNVISGNGIGVFFNGSRNNVVAGNLIGTDPTGFSALGNSIGIDMFDGFSHIIGGTDPGARNVISGNTAGGIIIDGQSGSIAQIQIQGNLVGTDINGTRALPNAAGIALDAPGVTIGGTTSAARNVISGNTNQGISVQVCDGALIEGNYIGTNAAGTAAVPNQTGVSFSVLATNATLGGATDGAGNLISGNSAYGVQIANSTATGILVAGNRIGTNAGGTAALGNAYGVYVFGSSNNTIGGTTAAARNLISGNITGVAVGGANGNLIEGNYIGTDLSGANAIPNVDGIDLLSGSNTAGGITSGAGNLVSGNSNIGIAVFASGDVIQGNRVGTDITGTTRLANSGPGIMLSGSNNTVGGTTASARNVVSGNGFGVDLFGVGATGNVVAGNYIGTNAGGTAALGNFHGVTLESGANNNVIGGTDAGAGNVISGNSIDGVALLSGGNRVQGNFIGTDAAGTHAVGNPNGILLQQGSGNTIGGTTTAAHNVISGNTNQAIDVRTSGNLIEGNLIGTDATGAAALSNLFGVAFNFGSAGAILGGTDTGAGNVISGNNIGVFIRADSITVQGNRVGTNSTGTTALGNEIGVANGGSNSTIGGTASGAGNLVSGNGTGISDGSNTLILGNLIGTDISGTHAVGNQTGVAEFGTHASVGGSAAGARNVISGNTSIGVNVFGGGVLIQGNYIGTDITGTEAVGNGTGVSISSNGNTIGGTDAGAGNLISGNLADGIALLPGTGGNLIEGNRIGTDVTGTQALGNIRGVFDRGSSNTTGGTQSGAGNLISGNRNNGAELNGGARFQGNFVGTDVSGTIALGNGGVGVAVSGSNNLIGGTDPGAGNVISGNKATGIEAFSGSANLVEGNTIGADVNGAAALPNFVGVAIDSGAANNTIGGRGAGAANQISGNRFSGVLLASPGNSVLGNLIGTDAGGSNALGNGSAGVSIISSNNTVGGPVAGAGNVISGNNVGVLISGNASGNQVQGNLIGTDGTGTAALPNSTGVRIDGGGASNNAIGGTAAGAGNVISGNTHEGIVITSSGNLVQGNFIGTDASGSVPLANAIGVSIAGSGNTVGGTAAGAGNLLSGNTMYGVFLSGSGATLNRVQGNLIGTDATGTAALSNGYGVFIDAASNNTIGGTPAAANRIAFNRNDGVLVQTGTGNAIRANSIFANGGQGIRLVNGGNNNQPAPVITSASSSVGFLTFQGTLTAAPSTTYTLEFFANTAADPSGFGQGQQFLGFITVTTDASGHASFAASFASDVQPGEFLTATATDPGNNTSAFSQDVLITG
jgi:hypothetical protein